MKLVRVIIYAALFPPIAWLFLSALNVVNVFGSLDSFFSALWISYVIGIVPAVLTGIAHVALERLGLHPILNAPVGAATLTLAHMVVFALNVEGVVASAFAGCFAALCCGAVARIGRQGGKA
jgi:hypothetical protein